MSDGQHPQGITVSGHSSVTEPSSGANRSRRGLIIGASIAVGVLLLGGGAFAAANLMSRGGEATPTALAEKVLVSTLAFDYAALSQTIAPSEGAMVEDLVTTYTNFSDEAFDLSDADLFLDIIRDNTEITTTELTWVEENIVGGEVVRVVPVSGTIVIDGDKERLEEQLREAIADYLHNAGGGNQDFISEEDVLYELENAMDEIYFPIELDLADVNSPFGFLSVYEDGGWYLSPLLSVFDVAFGGSEGYEQLGTSIIEGRGAENPEAAVQQALDGISSGNAVEFIARLPLAERRALSIYANDDYFLDSSGIYVFSDMSFEAGTESTRSGRSLLTYWTLEAPDGSMIDSSFCDQWNYCSFEVDLGEEFGLDGGIPFVVVQEEGGWYFSPLGTVTHFFVEVSENYEG